MGGTGQNGREPKPASNRETGNNKKRSTRSRRRPRTSPRSAAHHEALAAAERNGPGHDIPDHPLVAAADAEIVETMTQVDDCVAHVRTMKSFGYDTEFIGERSYLPHICLVQIATTERVFLVDPLADIDMTDVWNLIADPELETIVHAGQQDLEPVMRFVQQPAQNVFDTQIASGFARWPFPMSLRDLTNLCLGISLGKGLTFTDWSKRPLSKVHQRYAADDVRYLLAIRKLLQERLETSGNSQAAVDACDAVAAMNAGLFDIDARVQRLVGTRKMTRRQLAILERLAKMRETIAKDRNLPPRTVMKDDVITRLSREPAKVIDKLHNIKGMPRPLIESHGQMMLDLTREALDLDRDALPPLTYRDESPSERQSIDALWSMVSTYCYGQSIDPSVVGTRRDIASWYWKMIDQENVWPAFDSCWRGRLLDPLRETMLAGEGSLAFQWDDSLASTSDNDEQS